MRTVGFFFRTTPLGFRQVVQHVRLHVAIIVNWLIGALTCAMQNKRRQKLSWRGPLHSPRSRHKTNTTQEEGGKPNRSKTQSNKKNKTQPNTPTAANRRRKWPACQFNIVNNGGRGDRLTCTWWTRLLLFCVNSSEDVMSKTREAR